MTTGSDRYGVTVTFDLQGPQMADRSERKRVIDTITASCAAAGHGLTGDWIEQDDRKYRFMMLSEEGLSHILGDIRLVAVGNEGPVLIRTVDNWPLPWPPTDQSQSILAIIGAALKTIDKQTPGLKAGLEYKKLLHRGLKEDAVKAWEPRVEAVIRQDPAWFWHYLNSGAATDIVRSRCEITNFLNYRPSR